MITCEICGREFKNYRSLSKHITHKHKDITSEIYYLKYINTDENIKCPICGEDKKFKSLGFGFLKTCGNRECTNEIRKNTIYNEYGLDNISKLNTIKEKKKKTCLEKYGVDSYSKTKEYKDKYKNTCLIKYGVDNPNKSNKVRDKIKQTNLKKYGVVCSLNNKEIKDKFKNTMFERYGEDHPMRIDEFKDKARNTCIEKYGKECYIQTDEFKNKTKQTCLDKYGVGNYSKTNEFKEKYKKTSIERYGVDNYSKSEEFKNNINEYFIEIFKKLIKENRSDLEFIKITDKYYYTHHICKWKCKTCGNVFEDYARSTDSWLHPRCPSCNPTRYSSIENKVYNHIKEYISEDTIQRCTRQIIKPYELDIYIPYLGLAIECDGTYWHSDEVMLERYDMSYNKHCKLKENLCTNKDITLLRFTEYEIKNEFEKVKEIIDKYIITED